MFFVQFINHAQHELKPVIAITGRPDVMRKVTVEKLKNLGSWGVDLSIWFRFCDFKQENGTHFIEGIIYNGLCRLTAKR